MENDIEPLIGFDGLSTNISNIGKYDKFATFKKDHLDTFQFVNVPFMFYTNEMICQKLLPEQCFFAMENMKLYIEKRIKNELKQDYKLQCKIEKILQKAKERIKKLELKPKKKLQEKYNYKYFEDYFNPKQEF